MHCKQIENYLRPLHEGYLSSSLAAEVYEHAENCQNCKRKLELKPKIKSALIEHYMQINPSLKLKDKIRKLTAKQSIVIKFKPAIMAACLILLLGLGIFFEKSLLQLPKIHELHSLSNFHLLSNNIEDLGNHINISINKSHLTHFAEAGFTPHGALKIKKSFNRNIGVIALKNQDGHKVSICFLPKSYNLPYQTSSEVKSTSVKHGNSDSHQFIYWKGNKSTIALISSDLTHDELINLAFNLIGEV